MHLHRGPKTLVELATTCWGWSLFAVIPSSFVGVVWSATIPQPNSHPELAHRVLWVCGAGWLGLVLLITVIGCAYGRSRRLGSAHLHEVRLAQVTLAIVAGLVSLLLSRFQSAVISTILNVFVIVFSLQYAAIVRCVTGKTDKASLAIACVILVELAVIWWRV